MRSISLCLMIIAGLVWSTSLGAREYQEVEVADPYIELHTGPGAGYPVFHVVGRGEKITVLKRKTNWFKVLTPRGKKGWVSIDELEQTLRPWGEHTRIKRASREDFAKRRWEFGMMGGDFGGTAVLSYYGAFAFTPNLSTELSVSQSLGDFSSSLFASVDLVAQPFPEWWVSPYFALGTGVIRTEAKSTLVQPVDQVDQLSHVGVGLRSYLTERFLIRGEYKSYVIFTSSDENQEIDEWKLGFSVFF